MGEPAVRRGALRFISYSALFGFSGVVGKALALLTVPYLSRTLGPEGYGLADLAVSLTALLGIVVTFAGDMPTARRWALAPDDSARRRVLGDYVAATAGLSTLAMLLLLPASSLIASGLWDTRDATGLAALALVVVPLSAVQAALVNTLRIVRRPKAFAVLTTVDLTSQLALGVAFVALGLGPTGVILGYVLGSTVGVATAAVSARDTIALNPSFAPRTQLIREGLYFLPAVVAFLLADTVARIVVATGLGVTAVGAIAVAVRLSSLLLLATAAFSMAWGPIGMGLSSAKHPLFGRVLRAYTTVSSMAALFMAALSPEFVNVIAGSQYFQAASIMPGLLVAHALTGSHFVLATAAGVVDRGRSVAWTTTLAAAVQVVALIVVLPAIGVAAVGISALVGRLASAGLLAVSVRAAGGGGWSALVVWTLAAVVAALALSVVNLNPSETAAARYAAALGAALIGGAGIARALRS